MNVAARSVMIVSTARPFRMTVGAGRIERRPFCSGTRDPASSTMETITPCSYRVSSDLSGWIEAT
ncbi:hypothetical protein [Frondihabitans sucicola]|uniref:hypothetical protein n=1 Tax=Frondihabitans sucicola TaxID=1268041 RepID=UPI002574602C|nr:hypothetical protein [Frondihabitans sucicola]